MSFATTLKSGLIFRRRGSIFPETTAFHVTTHKNDLDFRHRDTGLNHILLDYQVADKEFVTRDAQTLPRFLFFVYSQDKNIRNDINRRHTGFGRDTYGVLCMRLRGVQRRVLRDRRERSAAREGRGRETAAGVARVPSNYDRMRTEVRRGKGFLRD